MQIHGPAHVHGPQSINGPHRTPTTPQAGQSRGVQGADELSISREADLVSRVRDVPEMRQERIAEIRRQIEAGTYETGEKMGAALDRLLDEIA